MENRKNELIAYIELMQGLLDSGFKCEQELKQAVKELNRLMMPTVDKSHVTVFVNSADQYEETLMTFNRLLHVAPEVRGNGRVGKATFRTDPCIVQILLIDEADVLADFHQFSRGITTNQVINRTNIVDIDRLFSVRVKK